MENLINETPLYLSNIYGQTNKNKIITFKFFVEWATTYTLESKEASKITIFDEKENILITGSKIDISLKENTIYFLEIQTLKESMDFELLVTPLKKNIATPYRLNILNDGHDIPLDSNNNIDPLKPAEIKMNKRLGGTYLYSNIPEAMPIEAVDSVLMQNKEITGDCFLTFEHQNRTGLPFVYLGYKIINENQNDLYVTVRNVGYQVDGSWLGEKSWMDYYGVKYEMDISSFNEEKLKWFHDYLNFDINYQASPIVPTTYRIPKGQYIYVIGGTTKDAFNNINVNKTANLKIGPHCCANGNVFFSIINGSAKGELVAYVDASKTNSPDVLIQNFRKYGDNDDMGGRIGISHHHGVIDTNPIWIFNDATPSQNLPVKYQPYYADSLKDSYVPFEEITNSYKHEYTGPSWKTHLSSQLHHDYVGEDIVENFTYYQGKEIKLSPNMANPAGNIWDFGNWMIEYQENCVLINQGYKTRTLKFYLINPGSLYVIIKDEKENILRKVATLTTCTGKKAVYECEIAPHSKKIISMQFVLAANNGGAVEHIVELI